MQIPPEDIFVASVSPLASPISSPTVLRTLPTRLPALSQKKSGKNQPREPDVICTPNFKRKNISASLAPSKKAKSPIESISTRKKNTPVSKNPPLSASKSKTQRGYETPKISSKRPRKISPGPVLDLTPWGSPLTPIPPDVCPPSDDEYHEIPHSRNVTIRRSRKTDVLVLDIKINLLDLETRSCK